MTEAGCVLEEDQNYFEERKTMIVSFLVRRKRTKLPHQVAASHSIGKKAHGIEIRRSINGTVRGEFQRGILLLLVPKKLEQVIQKEGGAIVGRVGDGALLLVKKEDAHWGRRRGRRLAKFLQRVRAEKEEDEYFDNPGVFT